MEDGKTKRINNRNGPQEMIWGDTRFQRIAFDDTDMAGLFGHHDGVIGHSNHQWILLKRDDFGVLEILLSLSPCKRTVTCHKPVRSDEGADGAKYQRNIRSRESSLPCGHWRATQITVLGVLRPCHLQGEMRQKHVKTLAGVRASTWVGNILLCVVLVLLEVAGQGDRVVDAVLAHLFIGLGWECHNLLGHCHRDGYRVIELKSSLGYRQGCGQARQDDAGTRDVVTGISSGFKDLRN